MNAAQMIESKIEQYEDAAGNHTDKLLVRDFRLFLESLAFEMEKEQHRLVRGLKAVNSFRIVENMSDEQKTLDQIRIMNNDHNLTLHPQHDEWEPI